MFALLVEALIQPSSLAAAENALTLEETQSLANSQNRDVQRAVLEVSRSQANLRSVMATRYPKLITLAFVGQQVTNLDGYPRNLALFPGALQPVTQQYRLGLQVREAAVALDIARQQLRLVKQRTVADVKKSYLGIVALKSAVEAREQLVAFLKELQKYVGEEVKRGQALPVDLQVVTATYARADYELDRDRDDLITNIQTLNRLLGRPPKTPIEVADVAIAPNPNITEESSIATALNERPEITQARLSVKQFSLKEKIELSKYIPDISFGALGTFSHNISPFLPKNFISIGFAGYWEPWDWGRRIQNSKVSERQMQQSRILLSDLTDSVSIEADNARRFLKVATKEIEAGALGESSAKEELRVTSKRYKAGSALLKDVMESAATYSKAIAENINAKTDYVGAQVELDRALGKDF
jgi:outer membrane protein